MWQVGSILFLHHANFYWGFQPLSLTFSLKVTFSQSHISLSHIFSQRNYSLAWVYFALHYFEIVFNGSCPAKNNYGEFSIIWWKDTNIAGKHGWCKYQEQSQKPVLIRPARPRSIPSLYPTWHSKLEEECTHSCTTPDLNWSLSAPHFNRANKLSRNPECSAPQWEPDDAWYSMNSSV